MVSDSKTVKNEIGKHRKFESPAKQSQTNALERVVNEYKLKCAEYEEKIQDLQRERASLIEAIRIISTDPTVTT